MYECVCFSHSINCINTYNISMNTTLYEYCQINLQCSPYSHDNAFKQHLEIKQMWVNVDILLNSQLHEIKKNAQLVHKKKLKTGRLTKNEVI